MTTGRAPRALLQAFLATAAVVAIAACAPPTSQSKALTDGRTTSTPPVQTVGPAPASADAGITLPPEGASAPMPALTAVAPARALVGGVAPSVVVTGSGFQARSTVEIDGAAIATSFVSNTELRATLPSAVMSDTAIHPLDVITSAPGGGRSVASSFTVENPVARVLDMLPNAVLEAATDTTVTVTGSSFVKGSVATLAGRPLATTYASSTQLAVVLPKAQLASAGTLPLLVVNPAPGGGASTALSFTVANPTVTVTSITPSSAVVGAAAQTITLAGTGFVAASAVSFNGSPIVTHYQSATALTADAPATALAATGSFSVVVTNPAPGGGVSLPATFIVGNPTPTLTSIAPASGTAGDPPTTITIDGTGFVAATQVDFNGTPSATTFVSATEVTAMLTAAQLAAAGTIAVDVVNPTPGGGTSNSETFTVDNATPVLTSITPSSIASGTGDTSISAFGSKFVSGSVVNASGAPLTTTFISATELRATVPATDLATAGSIGITVSSPDPGGSTSGAVTLTVTDSTSTGGDDGGATCDTTGVDVPLASAGASQIVTLDYSFGPVARFLYDPTDATSYTCPVATLSTSTSNYAAIVVQNTGTASALLQASAVCGSNDDAFLAVYASDTVPSADADREACTGYVANGAQGGGGLASAQSNGSSWCPALTVANGGAITLQPCAKAVLLVQPYDVTQLGAPSQLAVSLSGP